MFVQDFFKLSLIAPWLLSSQIALNTRDFLIWLALSGVPRVVPLAFVDVVVAITLLVTFVLGEAVVLLVLLVSPLGHRVT
jgi:hypothetical protein